MTDVLYAEDLEVGAEVAFGAWTFTEEAVIESAYGNVVLEVTGEGIVLMCPPG